MNYKLLLFVVAIAITSGCYDKRNTLHLDVKINDGESIYSFDGSYTMLDNDSAVIASLESDSCLYDPELIIKPIDDSVAQYFILNYDMTDTLKTCQPNHIVVKYIIGNSYITTYEGRDVRRKIIAFLFNDKGPFLSKGISVGDAISKIKALYNRDVLSGNIISIIEESEMAEIKLYFKDDIVTKIIYMDYESCYGLNLL